MKRTRGLAFFMLVGLGLGIALGALIEPPTVNIAVASDAGSWAKCGIKPPPPNGFWPDDAVCMCGNIGNGKTVCQWVWVRH